MHRMTNASNRRDEQKKLVLCASCTAIQRNWRRAPGHAELVQMASRKAERSDGELYLVASGYLDELTMKV